MPQTDQVVNGQAGSQPLVEGGTRQLVAGSCTHGNDRHGYRNVAQDCQDIRVRNQDDDAVHGLVPEMRNGIVDAFAGYFAKIGDADEVPCFPARLFNPQERVRRTELACLARKYPDGPGPPGHQAAGCGVPSIPKVRDGRFHALPGFSADIGMVVQDAGNGLVRDTGHLRNVTHDRGPGRQRGRVQRGRRVQPAAEPSGAPDCARGPAGGGCSPRDMGSYLASTPTGSALVAGAASVAGGVVFHLKRRPAEDPPPEPVRFLLKMSKPTASRSTKPLMSCW